MFVFLIDSNPLISVWLEAQAKARGENFYSLKDITSAAYMIHDLAPQVLVIDGKTAQTGGSEFLAALADYPEVKKIPVIGFGEALPEWCGALNVKGHISKPVNPELFHQQVLALLAEASI